MVVMGMTVQSWRRQLASARVEGAEARTQTMRTKRKTGRTERTGTMAATTTGSSKNISGECSRKTTQNATGSSTTARRKRRSVSSWRDITPSKRSEPRSTRGNSLRSVTKRIVSGKRPSTSADQRKSRSVDSRKKSGSAFRLRQPGDRKR